MHSYDPERAPDAEEWLALDEQIRIDLVEEHHRATRVKLPNIKAHATFHAIIENQIAEGLAPVVRAIARLTAEGMSRHEALHAVGSVLAEHIYDLLNIKNGDSNSMVIYNAAVERLTGASWRGG